MSEKALNAGYDGDSVAVLVLINLLLGSNFFYIGWDCPEPVVSAQALSNAEAMAS